MHIIGMFFVLSIAAIFILAAALRGTKKSLFFLVPAGVIFLILSSVILTYGGIDIPTGTDITVYNETKETGDVLRTENKTTEYSNLFHDEENMQRWFGLLMSAIGVMLILFGTAWRFV